MADVKPVDVEAPVAEVAPTVPEIKAEEPTPAPEVAAETTPAETAETPAEEPVKEATETKEPEEEVKPIYEGTLGYAPGPLAAAPIAYDCSLEC
jgi:hypothetical protein